MEESVDSFEAMKARLRAGHESAAEEVFDRYTRRLVGLAREKLPAKVARKVDPEDVMQSVLHCFFAGYKSGRFDRPGDWDQFWGLLARITNLKCRGKIARFQAQRRDVRREVEVLADADDSGAEPDAVAPEATPSEAIMLVELVELILGDLDGRDRRIVELALDGWRPDKIAGEIGRSERTVERVLKKLRERLEQMRDEAR